jgi:hypothetical protein
MNEVHNVTILFVRISALFETTENLNAFGLNVAQQLYAKSCLTHT